MAPDDKREAILDAALGLFVERGFHGTAVPSVAERAGVGAGTIYRYFDSKEGLVNALYQGWKRAMAGVVLDQFPAGAPARERFGALWQRLTAFGREHPHALQFLEMHHHASYLDEASRAVEEEFFQLATAFIRQAQTEQALKPIEPALIMAIVHGAFVWLVRWSCEGRIALTVEALAAAEQCCWEAIRR